MINAVDNTKLDFYKTLYNLRNNKIYVMDDTWLTKLYDNEKNKAKDECGASKPQDSSYKFTIGGKTYKVVPFRTYSNEERSFKKIESQEERLEFVTKNKDANKAIKKVKDNLTVRKDNKAIFELVNALVEILQNKVQISQYIDKIFKEPKNIALSVDRYEIRKDIAGWKQEKIRSFTQKEGEIVVGVQELVSYFSGLISKINMKCQKESEDASKEYKEKIKKIQQEREDALAPLSGIDEWLRKGRSYQEQSSTEKSEFEKQFLAEQKDHPDITFEDYLDTQWPIEKTNNLMKGVRDLVKDSKFLDLFRDF